MNSMINEFIHDTFFMLPFLFITYCVMEFVEHRGSAKFKARLASGSPFAPILAAIIGVFPQCGFAVLASGLYVNRSITLGTLLAVFISSSDEAIPILISMPKQSSTLVSIIIIKIVVAIVVGYGIDALMKQKLVKQNTMQSVHDRCHGMDKQLSSIFFTAAKHTIKIFGFILIINLLINAFFLFTKEVSIMNDLLAGSLFQPILAAAIGFIPNCAASIILTQFYIENVLSFGSLCAGLITSSGMGILVFIKMNKNKKDVLRVLCILLVTGSLIGILVQVFA